MAAKAKGHVSHVGVHKKTSQGRKRKLGSLSVSMMNKSKRRSWKRYRGQGK
jgi:hypothetical protein